MIVTLLDPAETVAERQPSPAPVVRSVTEYTPQPVLGKTVPAGAVNVTVEKPGVNPFVAVYSAEYETSVAEAEYELSPTVTSPSPVSAVSVIGTTTAVGSELVTTVGLFRPLVVALATPLAVTTTGSPAATVMPEVIVTAFEPADTVAERQPADWCVRVSVIE
jgi:hypothetical protein